MNGQETPTARFFEDAYRVFQKAEGTLGRTEFSYDIAGRDVRLRFAGQSLLEYITPPLSHLESRPGVSTRRSPSLQVCLWDDRSSGSSLSGPPWLEDQALDEERHAGWPSGIRPVVYVKGGRFEGIYEPRSGHLSLIDTARNLALYRVRSGATVPLNDRCVPLRAVFHWWGRHNGLQLIHAAAVGTAEFGMLLVGSGGSGKSTTALAALDSGLWYVGDDYVMVGAGLPAMVYSLYSSGKLYPRDIGRISGLKAAPRASGNDVQQKEILLLHQHVPERLARKLPLRAILVPKVTGRRDTRLTPVTVVRCLAALAPSTLVQLPGSGGEDLRRLTALVASLPRYLLELGTDVTGVQRAVRELATSCGMLTDAAP